MGWSSLVLGLRLQLQTMTRTGMRSHVCLDFS